MSEEGWGDEDGPAGAPRKRRFPKWLGWTCGCGCLLLTLVVGALVVFTWRTTRDAMDPEKQWPKLERLLPFDERPQHLQLAAGVSVFGISHFLLEDPERGLRAAVWSVPAAARPQFGPLLDPTADPFGVGRPVEPEETTVTVRGRSVPALRFARLEGAPGGPGIRIDLSGSGDPRVLQLRRIADGAALEDADVEAFLAPFDVWRGR